MNKWPEEAVQIIRDMVPTGASFRTIADAVNAYLGGEVFTRNAVIGKAYRLGIASPLTRSEHMATSHAERAAMQGRVLVKRPTVARSTRTLSFVGNGTLKCAPLPKPRKMPVVRDVAVLQNDTKGCQYIWADPREDPSKCGKPRAIVTTKRGESISSYCPGHHALTHRRGQHERAG